MDLPPVLAIETLRNAQRHGRAGTALTLVTAAPMVLIAFIALLAATEIGGLATLWLVLSLVAASALGVIAARNIRLGLGRRAALAALEGDRAKASLIGDVLEVRATDGPGSWRFTLDRRASEAMRRLPEARVVRKDG